MLSFRLINLTITCNELLRSNSTSFCFFLFYFLIRETTESESKYYFFLIPYVMFPETAVYLFVSIGEFLYV